MAKLWQGLRLQDRLAQELSNTSTAYKALVLEWLNSVQTDLAGAHSWPFLKIKVKKLIAAGVNEIDISPQIPSAPSVSATAGGALTSGSTYRFKVTFVIFDESGKEENSIESEPSVTSSGVAVSGGNLTATLTAIDTYDGDTGVKPATIWRRIYIQKDGTGDFTLVKTLQDNTTLTTTVNNNSDSTIEPPDRSMAEKLAGEDPFIEAQNLTLSEVSLEGIISSTPAGTTGTPSCYTRVGKDKIHIHPASSESFTLSYYVKKRPARIFADADRAMQLAVDLEPALYAGVIARGYEGKDKEGQETKFQKYENLKRIAIQDFSDKGGQFGYVEDVEGDWRGYRRY